MTDFDLIVLGAGPGGYRAAITASNAGMRTVLIEKNKAGGTCLQIGCIPSKILLDAAKWLEHGKSLAEAFAEPIPSFDYAKLICLSRKRVEIITNALGAAIKKNGVEVIEGEAKFINGNLVAVGENILSAKKIVIACGAVPKIPNFAPYPHHRVWTSRDALLSETSPERVVILGGGAIGCEFASFFSTLGIETTIIELMPRLLPLEDEDVSKTLERAFKKRGINVIAGAKIKSFWAKLDCATLSFETVREENVIRASHVLLATGIKPATEFLALEKTGVKLDERGFIRVNIPSYETDALGIYAIGDIISSSARPPLALAHVAEAEAKKVVAHIVGKTAQPINYGNIPICTFTIPEVASIGLTEEKAKEIKCPNPGHEIRARKIPYTALGKSTALNKREGFVKIVEHGDKFNGAYLRQIAGSQIVGECASEIIHILAEARNAEDTIDNMKSLIFQHPTWAELIQECLCV